MSGGSDLDVNFPVTPLDPLLLVNLKQLGVQSSPIELKSKFCNLGSDG